MPQDNLSRVDEHPLVAHGDLPRPTPALSELIEKWRQEAADSLERWPRGAILPAKKLRMCADELAAALATLDKIPRYVWRDGRAAMPPMAEMGNQTAAMLGRPTQEWEEQYVRWSDILAVLARS